MNKSTKKANGFLLVEALISITILIMVVATGISLLVMGFQAISYNAHSLEASWLAQEGANSIRGLRDTNWLRNGYDKANCWKKLESDCSAASDLNVGAYRLVLTGSNITFELGNPLNIGDGEISEDDKFYQLYYQDLDDLEDFDGDGTPDNDKQAVGNDSGVEESIFFRTIEVTTSDALTVEAVSTVTWREGRNIRKISIPVIVTNYES